MRIPPSSRRIEPFNWNVYAWGLIGLFTFFQVMEWPLGPKFLDIYYHLATATGFNEAGGFVAHSFWEYAPVGRPHLYPPVLHILQLALLKLGMPALEVGRFTELAVLVGFLITIWFVVQRLYRPRLAFFAILIASSAYPLYLVAITTPAFTLALIWGLLAFYSFERRRLLSAAVLLGLAFYTHLGMAAMNVAALIIYGALNRAKFTRVLGASGLSLVFATPFLMYEAIHMGYFNFVKVQENRFLEIDFAIYLLAIVGVFVIWRRKGRETYPLCLLLAMLPMIFSHRTRLLSGHGLLPLSLLAALAVDHLYKHFRNLRSVNRSVGFLLGVLVLFFAVAPVLAVNVHDKTFKVHLFDRSAIHYLVPVNQRHVRPKEYTIYFEKSYQQIVDVVKQHSDPQDLLWCDFNYGGGLIGLLANRATSSAMVPEIQPYRRFDALKAARLLIWFKRGDGSTATNMGPLMEALLCEKIADTDFAVIYRNNSGYAKKNVQTPLIPSVFLFLLLIGALGAVAFDVVRSKKLHGR